MPVPRDGFVGLSCGGTARRPNHRRTSHGEISVVWIARTRSSQLDADTGELGVFVLNGENAVAAVRRTAATGQPPTRRSDWYTLARSREARIECVVAAPSKIRRDGDKVKNDRRDAEHPVRLRCRQGPGPRPAPKKRRCAIRSRPGDTAPGSMRARHRLSKMLMRDGVQFDDGRAWTDRHRTWLKTVAGWRRRRRRCWTWRA